MQKLFNNEKWENRKIRIERWFESYLEYLKFLGLNIKNDRPSVFEMIQKNSQNSQIFSFSLYSWVTIFSQWKKTKKDDYLLQNLSKML